VSGVEREGMDLASIIALLRREMSKRECAYYVSAIMKMVKKYYPDATLTAVRRYLKLMENLGLLIVKRDGRFKCYALTDKYEELLKRR